MNESQSVTEDAELVILLSKIAETELEICRSRSRTYALCNHPSERFEGEDCAVDLKSATFKGIYNGEISSIGRLQVVGTCRDDIFYWSWNDDETASESYEQLRSLILSDGDLAPLASRRQFACKRASAEKLCQWIATKIGWTGAFELPAPTGNSFLILDLRPGDNYDDQISPDLWCSYCGRSSRMVRQLFQASATCSICNECVRQFVGLLAELEQSNGLSTDDASYMAPCLVCGDKTPRIFSNYGAICYECLRIPAFQAVQ
jgi:hypothetical protein